MVFQVRVLEQSQRDPGIRIQERKRFPQQHRPGMTRVCIAQFTGLHVQHRCKSRGEHTLRVLAAQFVVCLVQRFRWAHTRHQFFPDHGLRHGHEDRGNHSLA